MKRRTRLLLSILWFGFLGFAATSLVALEPLPEEEAKILEARLVPPPQSLKLGTRDFLLNQDLTVVINVAQDSDKAILTEQVPKIFHEWFQCEPNVQVNVSESNLSHREAWKMTAQEKTLTILANTAIGVLYGLQTVRQLAEVIPGTRTVTGWFVPEFEAEDAPTLDFRGVHLCWFPETNAARMEQGIRLAAYYKFNYVVLELWGVYPYRALPELAWAEHQISADEIGRLVRLGKELGVTLVPQFNMFGHAAASRVSSGKHVLLDQHPEYASLFEPDGWTWCVSNPETRKILHDIVRELVELFDHPCYFHLGCDEAYSAGTCSLCRRGNYQEKFLDHLLSLRDVLAEYQIRPMMWHDMFLQQGEPRWKGFTAFGSKRTVGLLETLPKDFIICDWEYGTPRPEETWPTMTYFQEKGFDVIACPWKNVEGIRSQGRSVAEKKQFGLLCTTWHHFYGIDMYQIMMEGSCAAWGTKRAPYSNNLGIFNQHLRQIGWDQKDLSYTETGHYDWQIPPESMNILD